jgi:uracil-DNA glycosylase family 4
MEKAPFAKCDECPFRDRRAAMTTGPTGAKIAFVSRSPGYHEAMQGKAFAGPSGKVLDHLLIKQGVTRNEILATNVVLCQSEGREDKGWEKAVECCAPRLEAELADAETIICGGSEASESIVDDFISIGADRGYPHHRNSPISDKQQRLIVTNNPAVVLRDDSSYPELVRDFRLAINPLPKPRLPEVIWIDNVLQAKKAAEQMYEQIVSMGQSVHVATDIEARGTENVKNAGLKHTAQVVCAGFSIRPERAVVFGERACTDDGFRKHSLRKLYELDNARFVWHNGKYDVKVLRHNGINARVDDDTMLLSWCLDERPGDPEAGSGGHSLEWLLKDELGWPKYEPWSVRHFKKTGELESAQARKDLYEYNGMDTAGTLSLLPEFIARAKADNVYERPYRLMLIRLSEALIKVELQGNLFDAEAACNILEAEVWPNLRDLRNQARKIVSIPTLNLNSPKQTSELFYDSWQLTHNLQRPKIERKGKRSSDAKVREVILRGEYSVIDGINRKAVEQFVKVFDDFKQLDKQRGTYLEGLVIKRSADGRIYTEFKIHGTESGRLSSANPNMQNITRTKEGLPNIRQAFIPDPGCVYVSADLSQAELRAIAVLSGDSSLRSIYTDTGRSLHKEVAAQFYGENYTYEQYVRAKNINFGVAYWQSAFSFAQLYNMPEKEAQDYIDFWWERFPKVKEWTNSIRDEVLSEGEIQSPFGHKRRFYVIPSDQSGRLHVIKEGINFLPQNIASNVTLWAMLRLAEDINWEIAQPRINVHDNIVLNVREDHVEEIALMVKQYMEESAKEVIGWDFPFKADVSVGPNWGSLNELDLDKGEPIAA